MRPVVVVGCQRCIFFRNVISLCATAKPPQRISSSADFEKPELREYEPLSQGRRGDREMAFPPHPHPAPAKAAVGMKIDEGKHCSWLVLASKECSGPCWSVDPLEWRQTVKPKNSCFSQC